MNSGCFSLCGCWILRSTGYVGADDSEAGCLSAEPLCWSSSRELTSGARVSVTNFFAAGRGKRSRACCLHRSSISCRDSFAFWKSNFCQKRIRNPFFSCSLLIAPSGWWTHFCLRYSDLWSHLIGVVTRLTESLPYDSKNISIYDLYRVRIIFHHLHQWSTACSLICKFVCH